VGEEVVVIGSPLGLSGTVSAGIVSAIREEGVSDVAQKDVFRGDSNYDARSWGIQITAAISPGSSGSPILTKGGDVIGVAVGTRLDGQNVNFGVPIEVAKTLIASVGANATPKPFPDVTTTDEAKPGDHPLLRNLGISAAALAGLALVVFAVGRIGAWRAGRG